MTNLLASNKKLIVGIYIALTVIKLFTANIYHQREEDPTIYFKLHPTLDNVFSGSDKSIDFYKNKYLWYRNRQYWEMFHDSSSYVVELIYDALIISWWASSAGLIVFAIRKILKS